jgi:hypothetical protein
VLTPPGSWRSPEELVALGFMRSRVVMMNEAHDGLRRSVRCRCLGQRVLPTAHHAEVRHLAMEALRPDFAAEANASRVVPEEPAGYLAHPEMRDLMGAALELGWALISYEADLALQPREFENLSMEETNWREDQQARNLAAVLDRLADDEKLLVWCGNSHLSKVSHTDWLPMGLLFAQHSGFDAFAIDQTRSVRFGNGDDPGTAVLVATHAGELARHGGSAGFLAGEARPDWRDFGVDAFILSTDNDLT